MPQQKIVIATVKAASGSDKNEFELDTINKDLQEGFFVKSWLVTPNNVNEFVTLTVLLEKLETKAAPGVKFGLDPSR